MKKRKPGAIARYSAKNSSIRSAMRSATSRFDSRGSSSRPVRSMKVTLFVSPRKPAPASRSELRTMKSKFFRASFGSALRALNSFENIAVSVADGAFRGFDPFRFPEVYDSVTRADVEAFLRESIVEERSALSILIPKKEGASQ